MSGKAVGGRSDDGEGRCDSYSAAAKDSTPKGAWRQNDVGMVISKHGESRWVADKSATEKVVKRATCSGRGAEQTSLSKLTGGNRPLLPCTSRAGNAKWYPLRHAPPPCFSFRLYQRSILPRTSCRWRGHTAKIRWNPTSRAPDGWHRHVHCQSVTHQSRRVFPVRTPFNVAHQAHPWVSPAQTTPRREPTSVSRYDPVPPFPSFLIKCPPLALLVSFSTVRSFGLWKKPPSFFKPLQRSGTVQSIHQVHVSRRPRYQPHHVSFDSLRRPRRVRSYPVAASTCADLDKLQPSQRDLCSRSCSRHKRHFPFQRDLCQFQIVEHHGRYH